MLTLSGWGSWALQRCKIFELGSATLDSLRFHVGRWDVSAALGHKVRWVPFILVEVENKG